MLNYITDITAQLAKVRGGYFFIFKIISMTNLTTSINNVVTDPLNRVAYSLA